MTKAQAQFMTKLSNADVELEKRIAYSNKLFLVLGMTSNCANTISKHGQRL